MARSTPLKFKKLKHKPYFLSKQSLLWVALFATIGIISLIASHAATSSSSIEPENGTSSAGASIVNDNSASGGQAVRFGAVSANTVTGGTDNTCQFKKADLPVHVAFCEGFNTAYNNDPSVNRSGDLLAQLWGVSRDNTAVNPGQGEYNRYYSAHLTGCGATQVVFPTKDVQVCSDGFLHEALNDGGELADDGGNSLPELAIYPKQPFDIAGGRTGTVSFDVSANSQGTHAAWPELWWTDQPVPTPGDNRSSQSAYARNSFGFGISGQCQSDTQYQDGGEDAYVGIGSMAITTNYSVSNIDYTNLGCVKKGSVTSLNHFEVRISSTHVEIWASDPGGANFHEIATANLTMPLTRGVLWMEDVHYNACKFDSQCDHDVAWDNFGFDGPALYRDLAFDVPDANVKNSSDSVTLGYSLADNPTLTVKGLFQLQTPTSALVTFGWYPLDSSVVPSVSVNGNPYITTPWPFEPGSSYAWRTIAVSVPLSQIKTGTNTLQFKGAEDTAISNVDLIMVAGSPVPAALQ